ncbi:MAG: TaqI-like C-terminal specificity domain-containing protein, partial [Bacillota bacterium]|nr:TaqI-like C-terminal specificity domain-containing protein [Bacillota bacterium]
EMLLLFEEFPWELKLNVNHGNTLEMNIEETFDIILGNPPYIGEKNNKTFFRDIKKNKFGRKYYESKMDYYYFFMYKGWELLAPNGVMGVITTNYFFTADGADKLRKFIKENISFKEIINFHEKKLFKEALGQHNVITVTSMKNNNENVIINNHDNIFEIKEKNLYSDNDYIQVYTDKKDYDLIDKIKKQSTFNLGDFFDIHQGIVSGADYLNEKKINFYQLERVETGQGIFVLTEEELSKYNLTDSKYLKRFHKNSDIDKFTINVKSNKYILYIDNEVELSETSKEYKYLEQFKPILESRREVIQGIRKWYALQWPREKSIFKIPKIVVPHRNICNKFAISLEDFYASADVYYIISKTVVFDLRVIAAILNSKLMYFWLFNIGKKKGNILELYSTPLKKIPIKYSEEILMANGKFDMKNFDFLNRVVYEMYNLNQEEIKKIEKFYNCMGTR